MVIAETLVGIQLVKASVSGIKQVIETCSDISEVAHHIDGIFEGHQHIENKLSKKQKPKEQAWENKRKWKKIGEESGKVAILIGVVLIMYFYISYACKGCI